MPYIMNALDQEVKTQAHGKWLSWKPQEVKQIHNENMARFLAEKRGENGLVEVHESIMEMDKTGFEYKEALYTRRVEGIKKFLEKQNSIVRNLEMSLRGDYERSGQKGNFLFESSKGEKIAYQNLVKYKEFEQEQKLNNADEIQKLRDDLYGNIKPEEIKSAKIEAPVESTRPSPLKSAK